MAAPDTNKLTSMHFYAWGRGLKTGLYYLRTRPSSVPEPKSTSHTKKLPEIFGEFVFLQEGNLGERGGERGREREREGES